MTAESLTPGQWLASEDSGCLQQRAARLTWLMEKAPRAEIWTFPGGWLGKHLFEEARYCFVHGQFIAAAVLGFAFVERTLASMFYGAGRNDLQKATSQKLVEEAVRVGWVQLDEADAFERARTLRNPLVHFRTPLHDDLPESRAVRSDSQPYDIVEADAKHVLEAMFRLVAKNAVG
jgi:hypothetical protein